MTDIIQGIIKANRRPIMTNIGINVLHKQLKTLGITRTHLSSLLPEWWDSSMAKTPAGLQEVQLKAAKIFNLKASSLLTNDVSPSFKTPHRKFKRENSKTHTDIEVAASLATSAATLAIQAYGVYSFNKDNLGTAAKIREELLELSGVWIGLDDLVEYCWKKGIIVLHLALHSSIKKMDGMSINVDGQPVIVLTSNKKKGFLIFDLAHELAHIALGHLENNSSLIDIELGRNSTSEDPEEKEADKFALEILSGEPEGVAPNNISSKIHLNNLESWANDIAHADQVDPCHAVLSFAKKTGKWPLAMKALQSFPQAASDYDLVKNKSFEYLNFGKLKVDEDTRLKTLILG